MSTTHTAGRVRYVFSKYSGRPADQISAADTLHELGLGDLEAIEISLDIEEIVEAEGSDAQWEACKTVGDFIALAERLVSEELAAA